MTKYRTDGYLLRVKGNGLCGIFVLWSEALMTLECNTNGNGLIYSVLTVEWESCGISRIEFLRLSFCSF